MRASVLAAQQAPTKWGPAQLLSFFGTCSPALLACLGETGLAVEQPAWAQASDVGGGTSGDAGQVAQDNRSPYCGVAPSAGPTAEERLQAEAAAGERMKPRGEPGGGQQDEGSANKGGDWTGIGNEQAGTT
ncbi:hypothetical protein ABPG75_013971 [Micractinium tetrahymenae]